MIWSGTTKSRGLISSCRLPTAENAMMERTPRERRAAMLAREGTSCGASSWCRPCRERKAMGMGAPLPVGEGWCRMVMGEEGEPQGVGTSRVAARVKPGRLWSPVPPMTAMRTGSAWWKGSSRQQRGVTVKCVRFFLPLYEVGTPAILLNPICTRLKLKGEVLVVVVEEEYRAMPCLRRAERINWRWC